MEERVSAEVAKRWHVRTVEGGSFCRGLDSRNLAAMDAEERDERAAALGIRARYEVVDTQLA